MLHAWVADDERLEPMAPDMPLERAIWIDLERPTGEEVAALAGLGFAIPSPDEMAAIELSSRFYREDGVEYLTVVVPGDLPGGERVAAPVTFILGAAQLVTVHHHAPRPFGTFPASMGRSTFGAGDHRRLFLGLVDEIVARQADIVEEIESDVDRVAARVLDEKTGSGHDSLRDALHTIGRAGEALARVRLGLLLMGRMLSTFAAWSEERDGGGALHPSLQALTADIQALEVHVDFLSGRLTLVTDTTLGLVNVAQNTTVRVLSAVAVLFLPPTLIASIYGMNFSDMPGLHAGWGYPVALALMVATAAGSWAYFKRKGWWW